MHCFKDTGWVLRDKNINIFVIKKHLIFMIFGGFIFFIMLDNLVFIFKERTSTYHHNSPNEAENLQMM